MTLPTAGNQLFSGISTLEQALDYHLDRGIVLNSNVANVDTPGYQPVDLGFLPSPTPGPVPLLATDPGHIDPDARPAMMVPFSDPIISPGNDQNAVDMDRELAKTAANTIRYNIATELAARRLGMLKYAAGDGSGG